MTRSCTNPEKRNSVSVAARAPYRAFNRANHSPNTKSRKPEFQRRPQNSPSEADSTGARMSGEASTPCCRQNSASRSNDPKCSRKINPVIPTQPASKPPPIRRAAHHSINAPNAVFSAAQAHARAGLPAAAPARNPRASMPGHSSR